MICAWKSIMYCTIFTVITIVSVEARPQNGLDLNQPLETMESDLEEAQNSYYDLPIQQQSVYPSIPLDRLQTLVARYNRPTSYLRSSLAELYRGPESKRQVKYRQCYFNPITCFKK